MSWTKGTEPTTGNFAKQDESQGGSLTEQNEAQSGSFTKSNESFIWISGLITGYFLAVLFHTGFVKISESV